MALNRSRLALREDGLLYRQIGYLLASGANLHEAMSVLGDESDKTQIKKVAQSISGDLARGDSIDRALGVFPRFFDQTLIYMLSQDHDKDKVADFLYAYADEIERSAEIRLSLVQTLVYPAKIFLVAMLLVTILMVFVVPVFTEMLLEYHSALPSPTRFLIEFSSIIRDFFPIFIAAILGMILILIYSKKTVYTLGRWVPGINTLFADLSVYSFSKFLSLLLPLEKPFSETMQHAAQMVPDLSFRKRIKAASQDVFDMERFKQRARENNLFPKLFLRTLEIGRRTQKLDKLLAELSRYYDRRITKRIVIYYNFLETASIVIVGMIVGAIAIALYLPLFSMAGVV